MKRLQLSLSRWSHAWKRTRCFWHVGMIDEWLGGVWGFPNALRSQEKEPDQERYIQSSGRSSFHIDVVSEKSSEICCEGSWLKIIFFIGGNDWCQSRRILAPSTIAEVFRFSLHPQTNHAADWPSSGGVWQSPSPASWGDCSADRKRVMSTVDFCGDFVSVFVSSFPADRVLLCPIETLKHLDLPHRSREMVVRCCDHLQTHSESLALKLWPSSNSPGVWELFGSGDVLHPRILELQIFEDGIAAGKSQDLDSLHFLH